MKEEKKNKPLRMIRLGGYLTILGILLGAGIGVIAVVNPSFFSIFIGISQYEAMSFFLGVNLPTSIVLVAFGYILATTSNLDGGSYWRPISLSVLSLVCVVASALSVFNFVSFFGGFIALLGATLAYNRPTFQSFSGRESCFLTETGALLIASSSTLFLLMWLVAQSLPTYLMTAWTSGFVSPPTFLIMIVISFLMFFVTPLLGLYSDHLGACGGLNLIMITTLSVFALQSQYAYVNLSVYLGVFMLVLGVILALFGGLGHIRLFLAGLTEPEVAGPVLRRQGYCAYCGRSVGKFAEFQSNCTHCGRSLAWNPGAPFCPFCGRVVPRDAHICPHCQERLD